ncbi:MAG: TIGR00269 family protein [Promethearchaeota archaeon]|nr:MAG: TIGR00269 family protein [Candidatus Lokiarchaeota archaeon]
MQNGTCNFCHKKDLVIQRRYSGEVLCKNCFINSIEKNIAKTISKYKMLKPRDNIVVAVSGGKDSITLLYNLIKIQEKKFFSKPLIALSVDEGIENYRNNSIKIALDFCKKYDICHKIVSFKEKIGKTLDEIISFKRNSHNYQNACNYCAALRRRILNDSAKDLGADVLVMGHNLTDFAETFLMNILFKRFQLISNQYLLKQENHSINKYFIKKISPLMRIPEEEILLYANLKQFDYYPSHCPYREKDPILRKRVLDFIQHCKDFSPEIEFNLFKGFLEMSELLYNQNIQKNYNHCEICGYPCGNVKICLYCKYLNEFKN